jgi:hypothetical protein
MMGSRGTWKATRLMAARTMCLAFSVASTGSSVTHESCSRMLAIWKRNWLRPPSATALRKVGSCMVGEQAATTTRLMPSSLMSSWMSIWPGSEHMYLYSRAMATPGSAAANSTTSETLTLPAMLLPQSQM